MKFQEIIERVREWRHPGASYHRRFSSEAKRRKIAEKWESDASLYDGSAERHRRDLSLAINTIGFPGYAKRRRRAVEIILKGLEQV